MFCNVLHQYIFILKFAFYAATNALLAFLLPALHASSLGMSQIPLAPNPVSSDHVQPAPYSRRWRYSHAVSCFSLRVVGKVEKTAQAIRPIHATT